MKGRSAHKTKEDTDSTRASHVTAIGKTPVHVELAPRRREAVPASGSRWLGAARRGGELNPTHGGRVNGV